MKYAVLILLCIVFSLAFAADVTLTKEEQEKCEKEGGCIFASMSAIGEQMKAIYEIGFRDGVAKCKARDA